MIRSGFLKESALETLSISLTHVEWVFLKEGAWNLDKNCGR
jgi:hypothetical protein